jgi:PAS domain S-box-containing protein
MQNLLSDELLATTLRAIGDGVISCDQKGCVVLMNGEAERLTGWAQAQVLGRPLKEVFVIVNELTRETVEDPVEKVFRMGGIVGMANHTLLIRPDQTEIAIDDSASPIYDEGNTLRGVVLIFRDVTERRRAEWNLELLSGSGKILGEARQQQGIVERIGGLISQHFADACVFDLLQPTGELLRTVGKHRVADRQSVVDRLHQFIPARSDINSAV